MIDLREVSDVSITTDRMAGWLVIMSLYGLNRPAGARLNKTYCKEFQLYSLGTPNGVKVTILLEELLWLVLSKRLTTSRLLSWMGINLFRLRKAQSKFKDSSLLTSRTEDVRVLICSYSSLPCWEIWIFCQAILWKGRFWIGLFWPSRWHLSSGDRTFLQLCLLKKLNIH